MRFPTKVHWIIALIIAIGVITYAKTDGFSSIDRLTGSAISVDKLSIANKDSDISCKKDMDRWLEIHNQRYGFSVFEYKTVNNQDELKEYQNEIPSRQADVNANFLSYPTEAIVLKIVISKEERDLGVCVCVNEKFVCEFG